MEEDFTQLTNAWSRSGQAVRRHHEFGSCPMTIVLQDEHRTVLDIYARDINANGMLFICPDLLRVGRRLEVHLLLPGAGMEIVLGRVVGHKRLDASSHGIAVEFDTPVNPRCLLVTAELPA